MGASPPLPRAEHLFCSDIESRSTPRENGDRVAEVPNAAGVPDEVGSGRFASGDTHRTGFRLDALYRRLLEPALREEAHPDASERESTQRLLDDDFELLRLYIFL